MGKIFLHFKNVLLFFFNLSQHETNTSDKEASFLELHLSISNDIVSTKNHDKRD